MYLYPLYMTFYHYFTLNFVEDDFEYFLGIFMMSLYQYFSSFMEIIGGYLIPYMISHLTNPSY